MMRTKGMRWKGVALASASAAIAISAFDAGRSHGAGATAERALVYSGSLQDADGTPLIGAHQIEVKLRSSSTEGGDVLCPSEPATVQLEGGRFSLPLQNECRNAFNRSSAVFVEVLVNGSSLGRVQAGAVPYAIEAAHATSTDVATHAASAETAAAATGALQTTLEDLQTTTDSEAASGYVRIGDTQLVWGVTPVNIIGGDFGTEYATVTLPVAFVDGGYAVLVTGGDPGLPAGFALGRPTLSNEMLLQYAGASGGPTATRSLNWLAIGRWK
jgi:hypothetical protein